MENENPIRTLGDYSRPSHEGYRNTIELPNENNVVPLRSDTIQLTYLTLMLHIGNLLPQDLLSKCDHRLIKLENLVQRLMEAHLARNSPVQVNKISYSREICSGSHDTQYCMENPEQAFVEYTFSCIDEAGGKWYTFKPKKNNLADFRKQGEMTNKIDTFLKAINDRMTRTLLSDTVKNLKLDVNSISPVLSTRSYPMEDPQSSSRPLNSINAIKTCSKQTSNFQKDELQTVIETGTPTPKEPEIALEDEFKDLHLNLPVLEF
nr:MAK10-like protein [Tanacetum cinerariifolium]